MDLEELEGETLTEIQFDTGEANGTISGNDTPPPDPSGRGSKDLAGNPTTAYITENLDTFAHRRGVTTLLSDPFFQGPPDKQKVT